jgi:hypothetical protein
MENHFLTLITCNLAQAMSLPLTGATAGRAEQTDGPAVRSDLGQSMGQFSISPTHKKTAPHFCGAVEVNF